MVWQICFQKNIRPRAAIDSSRKIMNNSYGETIVITYNFKHIRQIADIADPL